MINLFLPFFSSTPHLPLTPKASLPSGGNIHHPGLLIGILVLREAQHQLLPASPLVLMTPSTVGLPYFYDAQCWAA